MFQIFDNFQNVFSGFFGVISVIAEALCADRQINVNHFSGIFRLLMLS